MTIVVEILKNLRAIDIGKNMNRPLALSLVALIGYMTLIFYLSSQPADVSAGIEIFDIPRIIMHVGEYGILGLLMNLVVTQISSKNPKSVLYSAAFCSMYGVTDEVHQYFVPTRCFDICDILADTIGGLAGAVFLVILLNMLKVEKTGS